jgi:hypothetical protein
MVGMTPGTGESRSDDAPTFDEGGEPACWMHLFADGDADADSPSDHTISDHTASDDTASDDTASGREPARDRARS